MRACAQLPHTARTDTHRDSHTDTQNPPKKRQSKSKQRRRFFSKPSSVCVCVGVCGCVCVGVCVWVCVCVCVLTGVCAPLSSYCCFVTETFVGCVFTPAEVEEVVEEDEWPKKGKKRSARVHVLLREG